jgi:ABC-type glycerol-3-phosphate transport system substrate-binding protein
MMMNIKTFMAIAVVALTAACSETPADVTTSEAVETEAANADVTAPEFQVEEPAVGAGEHEQPR